MVNVAQNTHNDLIRLEFCAFRYYEVRNLSTLASSKCHNKYTGTLS
jgi:hypothetical protein